MQPQSVAEKKRDWSTTAAHGLIVVARQKQMLTSDDLWEWLRVFDVEPVDNRAMGAVFRNGYRDHLIVPLNQWQESRRLVAHRRPIRVWKSLLI